MHLVDMSGLDNYAIAAIVGYLMFAWYSIRWENKGRRMWDEE